MDFGFMRGDVATMLKRPEEASKYYETLKPATNYTKGSEGFNKIANLVNDLRYDNGMQMAATGVELANTIVIIHYQLIK